jgi:hypothetical protein
MTRSISSLIERAYNILKKKKTEQEDVNEKEETQNNEKSGFMSEEDYQNFFKFGKEFTKRKRYDSGYKFSHFGSDIYSEVKTAPFIIKQDLY